MLPSSHSLVTQSYLEQQKQDPISSKKTENNKMLNQQDDDEGKTSFCGLVRKNSVKDRTKILESIMNRRGEEKSVGDTLNGGDDSGKIVRSERPRRHTTEVGTQDWLKTKESGTTDQSGRGEIIVFLIRQISML